MGRKGVFSFLANALPFSSILYHCSYGNKEIDLGFMGSMRGEGLHDTECPEVIMTLLVFLKPSLPASVLCP